MRRTASTARPATSRTRRRTSNGWCPKAVVAPTTPTCDPVRRLAMNTVAELLKAKPARVVSVPPEMTVLDAIKVLAREDVGAAIVMTGNRLAGILSERDYT